jgi:hypothetical protein
VVEEILAAGFVGEEEEGKALAADEIAATCRQNLVPDILVLNSR